jgi:methionyl-tRNA formyltransferase
MPIRLVFFGTSDFSVPLLRALAIDARFSVVAVVTQPDRPVGRKAVLTSPPIKIAAIELGLPVLAFETLKTPEAIEKLASLSFEAAAVVSYGQIIPQAILDLAPERFLNLHGSVLPAYRGASPIAEAIKRGDSMTGTTVMVMDKQMDHGPVLRSIRIPILPTDTTETLSNRLAEESIPLFGETIFQYLAGTLTATPQAHEEATFCPLLKRADGFLDLQAPATAIERLIRAYTPWPGTHTLFEGKTLKILAARIGDATSEPAGTFFLKAHELHVACQDGSSLVLETVQPEGKNAMSGTSFANGQRLFAKR